MPDTKIPSNVKKMEKTLLEMEALFLEQRNRMFAMEKEFTHFKTYAVSFIRSIKKACEKKPRKPSGFLIPVNISNELCDFLNVPHGSQVARTEVTKYLIDYITQEKLIHPEKKTRIVPDEKLMALLGPEADLATLTRFTIQKYMNKHYLQRDNNLIL